MKKKNLNKIETIQLFRRKNFRGQREVMFSFTKNKPFTIFARKF